MLGSALPIMLTPVQSRDDDRLALGPRKRDPNHDSAQSAVYGVAMRNRIIALGLGLTLGFAPIAMMAPAASAAAPADKLVSLSQAELKEAGFPRRPNTTAWGKGTAKVSPHKASINEPITISGTAPKSIKPGTVLMMQRFLPSNRKGDGTFQNLELITSTVDANRSFTMIANLGRPGLWGYRVGYLTEGNSPEFIGFQFQARTTTASSAPASDGSSSNDS